MADNSKLHATITGDAGAPTVVFLHGFLGAADDWENVIEDMAAVRRCVVLDLPGHGASTRLANGEAYSFEGASACIAATLDALGVEEAALVGYSMGGRLALNLAVKFPERWTGVVLESATPGLESEQERAMRLTADEDWARRLECDPLETFLKDWYGQAIFALRAPDEPAIHAMLERRRRNSPSELALAMRGMGLGRQPSLWPALGQLDMPVLCVAGEFDLKYVETSERMRNLCRRGARVIVSSSGHNVHVDNPEGYLRDVRGFLMALQ